MSLVVCIYIKMVSANVNAGLQLPRTINFNTLLPGAAWRKSFINMTHLSENNIVNFLAHYHSALNFGLVFGGWKEVELTMPWQKSYQ